MQQAFAADIFSSRNPAFSAVAEDVRRQVIAVGREQFADRLAAIDSIEQFGGSEVNSNNFRITAGASQYLLKRLAWRPDLRALLSQLGIFDWLHEEGILVPAVLRNTENQLLCSSASAHWCLFEFVEGDFFSGASTQLLATAHEIGRLQAALNARPRNLVAPKRWSYRTQEDREIFLQASRRRAEWSGIFGSKLAGQLDAAWERIERIDAELSARHSEIEALTDEVCHCDLHPHNILMSGARPAAFIDFESLTAMPVAAALGFAIYKLVKQHVVASGAYDEAQLRSMTMAFVAALRDADATLEVGADKLRLMALAEVERRLLVVLRLNLLDRNVAWNHVLSIQIAGLQEIELLFGAPSSPPR